MNTRGLPTIVRFNLKVRRTPTCWLWKNYINKWGYGVFRFKDKTQLAHRVAYRLYIGMIPKDMCVCHKCDNPKCVNPKHLFLGTQTDNVRDRDRKHRGGSAPGEKHGNAKLTNKKVREIRKKYIPYLYSFSKLAKEFGVKRGTIKRIVHKRTWRHI